MNKLILIFVLSLSFLKSHGQLIVDNSAPYNNPTYLVNNVLMGGGITATGVTYSGDPTQIGYFDGSATNVGISSGILLTSGDIYSAVGPNNTSGITGLNPMSSGTDPDLAVIAAAGTNDEAILEFDFVPTGDSIKFDFVFGSDEYLEFVGSFNDAFGFFLSGPGIAGPFSGGAENIALVPGTATPITINNVNDVSNPAYYINNGDGFTAPMNTDSTYIQYDGFTVVMQARAAVQCGQTYHIKIAVCDAMDNVLDSGVFLKAGSFTTTNINLSANIDYGVNDTTMVEGCGLALLSFIRAGNLSLSQWIQISYSGSASNGIDYNLLPDSIEFLPGQDSVFLNINALFDGIPEGIESLIISVLSTNCGVIDTTNINLFISDVDPITITSQDTTVSCPGDSVTLYVGVTGGYGTYGYLWNTGATDTSITMAPTSTTTYTLTVTDTCGITQATTSITVVVPIFAPPTVNLGGDISLLCVGDSAYLSGVITGSPLIYSWTQGSTVLGTTATLAVAPAVTTTYVLTITNTCSGVSVNDDVQVIVPNYLPLTLTMSNDTTVCSGMPVDLLVTASGGEGTYSYLWSNTSTVPTITIQTDVLTNYGVTVIDGCGNSVIDNVVVTISTIVGDFTSEFAGGNNVQFYGSSPAVVSSWYWDFGDGYFGSGQNPIHTYNPLSVLDVTLFVYNSYGCSDSITHVIYPPARLYIPNAFTPNGDGYNDYFGASGFGIKSFRLMVFNRWGELLFNSEDISHFWDGKVKGLDAAIGTYVYKVEYSDYKNYHYQDMGHVSLLR